MKPSLCLTALAATQTSILEVGKKTLFGSAPAPKIDRHDPVRIVPSKDVTLHYETGPDAPGHTNLNVTHIMKYPTILLEEIASLINVDCEANSVAMTFNDSSIFASVRGTWSTNQTLVLVTNHMGDCDAELERGFFVAKRLEWDSKNLICTAKTVKTDVEHTAEITEITFGGLPANAIRKRALVLDPSFTLATTIGLPKDTVLYQQDPYLTVRASDASFAAEATFSGYLKFNWWGFKLENLHFDLDASFDTKLGISADVRAAYTNTFSYAPDALQYGFVVPGILEIGPQLQFSVDALVGASAAVNISAAVGVSLPNGNVHLDVLDSSKTSMNGWKPVYFAEADISGKAVAQINPTASLTVELEVRFFGGLLDLSSGVTAKPGFTNSFILSGQEGISTGGPIVPALPGSKPVVGSKAVATAASCPNGLAIDSDFSFGIEAYVTQWWRGQLYNINVPILDKCYSWK